MTNTKKNKMKPNTTFRELAALQREQIAKQKPATIEEVRAQITRLQKQSEKSFALAAPKAQEDLKKITTPLSRNDARRICIWLFRKQITIEMIAKDVLVELQETD
ncbi:MAG TPA: hypothetical protein VKG26_12275, partial [Bacteroidia bacterium]|nr:hypothetical protein [Bacteroidia bacterium]